MHVQWFSCQNDRADYCDIIKQCHENLLMCKREGSIKRGVQSKLGEFGCCCIVI